MFGKKEVTISLNTAMPENKAHGVLWARPIENTETNPIARAIKNGYQAIVFRADRPELLAAPRRSTIRDIFEQARKLGLDLLHVELVVDGETKLYAYS